VRGLYEELGTIHVADIIDLAAVPGSEFDARAAPP
jgi:hypothetical protein